MILKRILIVLGLAAPALSSTTLRAEQHVCAECGEEACCRAYCRCVPSTEEKKKLCFDCKCEDFCVPGPSCYLGSKCEAMPLPGKEEACGCSNCCITWNLWKPRCAEVRTRKVLVVHEVKKEVPTFKWQVEYLCDSCRDCCADAMPLRPQQGAEIVPVSAEAPIATPAPAAKTAEKKSWWSNLFSK